MRNKWNLYNFLVLIMHDISKCECSQQIGLQLNNYSGNQIYEIRQYLKKRLYDATRLEEERIDKKIPPRTCESILSLIPAHISISFNFYKLGT